MTQISLSKALAIIDAERGKSLEKRKDYSKGTIWYEKFSYNLRCLNRLKKEFSHLSDADQLPLGL